MDAQQIRKLKPMLAKYLSEYDDCFSRSEPAENLRVYVSGQLSDLPRKSIEPMADRAGVPPRTLQQFLSLAAWDEQLMVDRLAEIVARDHSHPLSIGVIDETSAPKKGDKTPGVKRQWCGATGKVDNCVVMVREVLASKVIHTDDTPVDVLDRHLPETRIGRFWVYVGDGDHPYDVFTYTANRSRDGPVTFLKGWGKDARRYLQADAFGGYDIIYEGRAGGQVTEVACWVHARRKFYEARTSDSGVAMQALAYIRLLYDVEDEAKEQFRRQGEGARPLAAIQMELRQAKAMPLLAQFKAWLDSRQATCGGPVLPKSPMSQAIGYVLNQWDALNVYATDGRLAIDNNAAENALRRIAIGRKNWLFCGSDNGGHTAAVLFSLIATCQRHDVDPFAYLRDVLTRIAAHPMHRLAELLPDRWKPVDPSSA